MTTTDPSAAQDIKFGEEHELTLHRYSTNTDNRGFADIHCHMLAGVDDGARSLQEMAHMAEQAKNEGVDVVCFTPHSGLFGEDADPQYLKSIFAQAMIFLEKNFPNMRFYLGSEIYYSCDIPEKLKKGAYLPINSSRYVLVEFSPGADFFAVKNCVKFITAAGYIPIIAHVERYKALYEQRSAIKNLKKMGAVIQVNSQNVTKRKLFAQNVCKKLLRHGLVDIIASDCHDTAARAPKMRKCYEYVGDKFGWEYADTLMKINPRLILANKAIVRLRF